MNWFQKNNKKLIFFKNETPASLDRDGFCTLRSKPYARTNATEEEQTLQVHFKAALKRIKNGEQDQFSECFQELFSFQTPIMKLHFVNCFSI